MTQENYVPFSERYGYVHREIQIESIDEALRNGLWNVFIAHVWEPMAEWERSSISSSMDDFCKNLWERHFKETRDSLDDFKGIRCYDCDRIRSEIKERMRHYDWYEVYDFLEFVMNNFPSDGSKDKYIAYCNSVLKQEKSGYRLVNGLFTPIISDIEIESIESAEMIGGPVAIQLRSALNKLSDRQTPDYRNSIKESISAVESQARRIMGDKNATLGKLLIRMERELGLPTPVKEAFSTLYGYASGSSGARHGPLEAKEMEVEFDLAKFMLVACSAFINFAVTLEEPHEVDE